MFIPFAILCLAASAALIASERREWRTGVWLFKPLAAAAFVAAALASGALDSIYGRWVLLGLVLSAAGDVLLIPRSNGAPFLLGMSSFLLAHVAYAFGFWSLPHASAVLAGSAIGVAAASFAALRWLLPYLSSPFSIAVPVYVLVIGAMLALSAAASWASGFVSPFAGALSFAVSDLFVARERFVRTGFENTALGLPLYFGAQLVLAGSICEVVL